MRFRLTGAHRTAHRRAAHIHIQLAHQPLAHPFHRRHWRHQFLVAVPLARRQRHTELFRSSIFVVCVRALRRLPRASGRGQRHLLLLLLAIVPIPLQPFHDFGAVLVGQRLSDAVVVATAQRVVRMVGTVTVGVRETVRTVGHRTDERTFAGVQTLMGFQLTALGEGARATRVVAGVGAFA